jgi:hypothetical protein
MTQLDSKIISALRTVLDDVCGHLPVNSIAARTFVASRMLERAHGSDPTYDDLKKAGLEALKVAPLMRR